MNGIRPAGEALLQKISVDPSEPRAHLVHALPQPNLPDETNQWRWRNQDHYLETFENVLAALRQQIPTYFGTLSLAKITASGEVLELGIVGHKVVTDAGVVKIVSFLNKGDVSTGQNWLYHGIGTGTAAEAAANTGLTAELDTEYATSNTRPSGSQGVGATSKVYRTAATVAIGTVGGAQVITEHGVFSAPSVGSGTLLDRSMFSGSSITLNSNEAVAAQYDLTIASGG